jgi:hypothetical protein
MQQAKEVGQHLRIELIKHRRQGRLEVRFVPINPAENVDLAGPVDSLCDQLAYGFATMFDIKGKIIQED